MKITELHVEGFRSLHDVLWKPGDLNVLIGPNAGGKSNLLKALEMLSASARSELADYVGRAGGMGAVVWNSADSVKIKIETQPGQSRGAIRETLTYALRLARLRSQHVVTAESLMARVPTVGSKRSSDPLLVRNRGLATIYDSPGGDGIEPTGDVPEEETLLSSSAGPFAVSPIVASFRSELASWRTHQWFDTSEDAPVRQGNVARVEHHVDGRGATVVSVLHTLYSTSGEFKRTVDAALSTAFGDEYRELVFPPAADHRVQLGIRWRSLAQPASAADLSDGTLRLLYLLAILADPDPPGLIAIDEPETGLHPGMLPIVAEHAQEAALRAQVILTTHSPEFLDAFTGSPPTTTVVTAEEGKTHLKALSGDALDYWLKEYSLGRLFRSGELEALE